MHEEVKCSFALCQMQLTMHGQVKNEFVQKHEYAWIVE